jgi:hypothetical protein
MSRKTVFFWVAILFAWNYSAISSKILLLGPATQIVQTISIVVFLACLVYVLFYVVLFFREYQSSSGRALQKILQECSAQKTATNSTIPVTFHVYVGFLNTVKTVEVKTLVPKDQAIALLKRLRNFNFRWGLFGLGGLFVPFLTMFEYFKQKQMALKAITQ